MKIPEIKTKTIIQNKADKKHLWFGFDYNMNLYQGCHHGCIYCDSRSECYHIENFQKNFVLKEEKVSLQLARCQIPIIIMNNN